MKIAVTYDNGEIFQHFGHTECFKVYEEKDGEITGSYLVDSNGSGHSALANLLGSEGIDALICGGIGGGAQAALEERGIELVAGISGDADEAVEAYLRGELVSTGANCDHHHEEGHSCGEGGCGHHEEGGCGHCGGGCGGCGAPQMEGKNVGKTCRVHYTGTLNDGTKFDSSYDRNEPLEFVCGVGMMIHGFDKAVAEMEVGEVKNIHLMPEEAYGEADPRAIFSMKIAMLPGSEELEVGDQAYLQDMYGQNHVVKVVAKDDENITLDANHEMAGKELNFLIELVEVVE